MQRCHAPDAPIFGLNEINDLRDPWWKIVACHDTRLQLKLKYLNMATSSGETMIWMLDLMPQFSTWWWIGT